MSTPALGAVFSSGDNPPLFIHPHPPRHDPDFHRYLTASDISEFAHLRHIESPSDIDRSASASDASQSLKEALNDYPESREGGDGVRFGVEVESEDGIEPGCYNEIVLFVKERALLLRDRLVKLLCNGAP